MKNTVNIRNIDMSKYYRITNTKNFEELGRAYAVLMNSMSEQYHIVGNLFYRMSEQGKHIQKLNPDKKVSFDGNTPNFNTAYFCWNFLPRDYIMCHLEHNNSGKHYVPSRMWGDCPTAAQGAQI